MGRGEKWHFAPLQLGTVDPAVDWRRGQGRRPEGSLCWGVQAILLLHSKHWVHVCTCVEVDQTDVDLLVRLDTDDPRTGAR